MKLVERVEDEGGQGDGDAEWGMPHLPCVGREPGRQVGKGEEGGRGGTHERNQEDHETDPMTDNKELKSPAPDLVARAPGEPSERGRGESQHHPLNLAHRRVREKEATHDRHARDRNDAEGHVGDEGRDEDGRLGLGRKRDVGFGPFVDCERGGEEGQGRGEGASAVGGGRQPVDARERIEGDKEGKLGVKEGRQKRRLGDPQ